MEMFTTDEDLGKVRANMTLADLKVKLAEHVIAQAGSGKPEEVWSILTEMKVGAWRRSSLLEKLRLIFSFS